MVETGILFYSDPLVVIPPADHAMPKYRQKSNPDSRLDFGYAYKKLYEFLRKEKITYVDLLSDFTNKTEDFYWERDLHLNQNGHEQTAEGVYKTLAREKLS